MDILMFSGGLDSTYLLQEMLNTNQNLHVHHVSIRNTVEHKMQEPQDTACNNIINHMKELGYIFEYTESIHEIRFGRTTIFDSDVLCLHAIHLCKNYEEFTTVSFGWVMDDIVRPRIQYRMEKQYTQKLWTALCESSQSKYAPKKLLFPLLDNKIDKKYILNKLSPNLVNLCWSCRNPIDGKPCGRCIPCRQMQSI